MKEARIAALSIVCKKKVMWELDQGEETRAEEEDQQKQQKITDRQQIEFGTYMHRFTLLYRKTLQEASEIQADMGKDGSKNEVLQIMRMNDDGFLFNTLGEMKGVESEQTSRKKPMEFSLVAAIAGNQGRRATVVVGVQDHQAKKKGHCRRGEHRW
ncbi:hypothetical protein L6452_26173 [Arctium lappa]|uniref:Uncharacterized protein n=1 Tax=Arctium lappa TaxID=4217 RepID=A0ACB9ABD8_ARCLA|nr:hypothetical protein L6452_26173 [Arctium lappa]